MSDTQKQPSPILDRIQGPADVKALPWEQLPQLCQELRQEILETTSRNGGHLAANLGAVELTVALHRIFDSPADSFVWDVGHQCYSHKLLTGRRERFSTLRQKDGIAGFPKPKESVHDAFIAGHSSTSLSVASGIAKAKTLRGDPHSTIAILGDGAFTGGMVYEALNNAARSSDRLIVILNDNKMSISKNESSLSKYLSTIRSKPRYFAMKDGVQWACRQIPLVGKPLEAGLQKMKSIVKGSIYGSNFFEELGFRYLGPVDGHNLEQLCDVLQRAKKLACPVFLYVETQKGKGYPYAEENPGEFHGTSGFDLATGQRPHKGGSSFSDEFGKELTALGQKDERICAITAAMKYGTGLNHFSKVFKSRGRFFDVGIAEQHAITFGAGLASQGLLPVFAVYSSFLQRGYDQLIHDCSIEPQHLVLAIDRAGLVGADGETHNGLFDVAMLQTVPGLSLYAPASYEELRWCLRQCLYEEKGLCALRYPRGGEDSDFAALLVPGPWQQLLPGDGKRLVISYGTVCKEAYAAAKCWGAGLLKLTHLFPLEEELLTQIQGYETILFVEEGSRQSGLGQTLGQRLLERGYQGRYFHRGVENCFVPQMTPAQATQWCRLDRESLLADFGAAFSQRENA